MDREEKREGKEQKIFYFIKKFIEENGDSPSFREIAGEFGCSTNTVSNVLNNLRAQDFISFEDGKSRTIVIVNNMGS